MEIKKGIKVSPGFAISTAFVLDSEEFRIRQRFVRDDGADAEVERFEKAVVEAAKEIKLIQEQINEQAGSEYVPIFEAHLKMLKDKSMHDEVKSRILHNKFTAEYAISRVLRRFIKHFRGIDDNYFSQRFQDIQDIEKRLMRFLLGEKREALNTLRHAVVLIARDLTPSQVATLNTDHVVGLATDAGGPTSHSSIMARALGIPAVFGLETITADISGGDKVIIDGNTGMVIVSPDVDTLKRYEDLAKGYHAFEDKLKKLKNLPAKTTDGVKIRLLANIELPGELEAVKNTGAEGIGLFRSEFLYMDKQQKSREETESEIYSRIAKEMGNAPVVVRTFDLGADKFFEGVEKPLEKNPFLGQRSIRLCFDELDMFKSQLRSILRASAFGNVRVLFPMISCLEEVKRVKLILSDVMEELEEDRIPFNKNIQTGIMIEVPSAALIIDLLVKEVDFFNIGTNDLIQYTVAVDRQNERIAELYQPAHPAVLRLLKNIAKTCARFEKDVCLCGEMSATPEYVILLLGLGFRTLSATPGSLPSVKKIIRSISMKEAQAIAKKALTFDNARETVNYLMERTRKIVPETF